MAENGVGPLERGLAVLTELAHAPEGRMRAGDLARRTGLARSPVDRIATTLERLGYLRVEDRELVLAPRLMELGAAYLRGSAVAGPLAPLCEQLADTLDESVSLAVPDGDAVRFVVQTVRRRALSVAFRIGDAVPAERSAAGTLAAVGWSEADFVRWRARREADPEDARFPAVPHPRGGRRDEAEFRARVAEAAARGWAVDDQLVEPGLIAVAVPVTDAAGAFVCALSAVSHTSRHDTPGLVAAALEPLRRAAREMSAALGARPAPNRTPAERQDPSKAAKSELGPEYLQSLARGLAVLRALGDTPGGGAGGRDDTPGGMTLSAAAEATGLPRATARRSLLTLEQLGYVAACDGRFRLLPRVLDLGYPLLSGLTLGELAQPHLSALAARLHHSASMAVLDGTDIRYVARAAAGRIMRVSISVGTRFPAHATSMGRVLLAGLPPEERAARLAAADLAPLTDRTVTDPSHLAAILDRVARDGYAHVTEELENGLQSLAVPVHDRDGHVVAAVNVALHASPSEPPPATVLPALRDTATRITADTAASFTPPPA